LLRPYRFERTAAAAAAIGLLALVAVAAVHLAARGWLNAGTPRGWYIAYLLALIVAAFVVAPLPRLAAVLLSVAAIEAGLGLGSLVLYKYRLIASPGLVPLDEPSYAFDWHPLLQALPIPTTGGEVAAGAAPVNSDRTRGREYTAEALRGKIIVALFGGSTTFDDQPEGSSWPERLQHILGDRYAVINRGMAGHSTAEHVVQTAFYERIKGATPRCAVYYVGWNDLRSAHTPGLDPAYANFHLPAQADAFRTRPTDASGAISPSAIFLSRLAALAFDTIRVTYPDGRASGEPDPALEATFARNVATISAINRQRGIRTIWVGQLMDRHRLVGETPSWWIPLVPPRAVFGLIGRLNGILEREAGALGDAYVALPVEKFDDAGFQDEGHFSEQGSLLFATLLAPAVAANCR
jgi:hypothetical protein